MSKRGWCLIGLVLLAAACSSVLEPKREAYSPNSATVGQLGQDSSVARPEPHGKIVP